MKVILKQDIKGVGKTDEVVNVTPGYARNYLFPRKLAAEATESEMRELARRHHVVEQKGEKLVVEAQDVAAKLAETTITIHGRAGTGTKLYGSITPHDIAEAVKEQAGIELDKRKIHIADPIKSAGSHSVPVRLHRDVGFDLKVEVVTE